MSFSVFYAVRFSPAPELGEWLNVAVVGEGISERKAGVVVPESLDRIEAAFGTDAVERVKAICFDLAGLVSALESAHIRGEETQPIPMAMKDMALSMSFSDQIVVFEGTFEEALKSVASKYLFEGSEEATVVSASAVSGDAAHVSTPDFETEIAKFASSFQSKLTQISKVALEHGQKVVDNIIHGPDAKTVLIIGGESNLQSALTPKLAKIGKKVKHLDIEKKPKKAELKDAYSNVDVVIFIPDPSVTGLKPALIDRTTAVGDVISFATTAKATGAQRFIVAGEQGISPEVYEQFEVALKEIGDEKFAVTVLRFGELFGHSQFNHWYGDLHDEAGHLETNSTVNILTAHAVVNGNVSATNTEIKSFLHVEDAVAAILAVLSAPHETVNRQLYSVGSESQVRTVSEIVELIKQQVPNAQFTVDGNEPSQLADHSSLTKIYEELGFTPVQTLEDGIAQLKRALEDGSVSGYLAVRFDTPQVSASNEPPAPGSPEIQWETLAMQPKTAETQDATKDQSRQRH